MIPVAGIARWRPGKTQQKRNRRRHASRTRSNQALVSDGTDLVVFAVLQRPPLYFQQTRSYLHQDLPFLMCCSLSDENGGDSSQQDSHKVSYKSIALLSVRQKCAPDHHSKFQVPDWRSDSWPYDSVWSLRKVDGSVTL